MVINFSTKGIIIRKVECRDCDLIITFCTPDRGIITALGKNAKKSKKRFQGALELFSLSEIVCSIGKNRQMPILQEASVIEPFYSIRNSIEKTSYASLWAETINRWIQPEEGQEIYDVLRYSLKQMDTGIISHTLSIIFISKFLEIEGIWPALTQCAVCKKNLDLIKEHNLFFDPSKGGFVCGSCSPSYKKFAITKGSLKQLLWIVNHDHDLESVLRLKIAPADLAEILYLLEAFLSYQLGSEPLSIKVLRQVRRI